MEFFEQSDSRSCVSKLYIICSYFKSLKFVSGLEPLRSHSRKLLIKSRNQNIFLIFKMNPTRYIVFCPSKIIGEGGSPRTTSISYSAKVCTFIKIFTICTIFTYGFFPIVCTKNDCFVSLYIPVLLELVFIKGDHYTIRLSLTFVISFGSFGSNFFNFLNTCIFVTIMYCIFIPLRKNNRSSTTATTATIN